MQPERSHRPGDLLDRAGGREGDAHPPPAPRQKTPQPPALVVALDKAEQFEIVAAEHQAVIGRTLPDMAAPGRRGKSEPGPIRARAFEVAHRDNHMIDTRQTVPHRPSSRIRPNFTKAA